MSRLSRNDLELLLLFAVVVAIGVVILVLLSFVY